MILLGTPCPSMRQACHKNRASERMRLECGWICCPLTSSCVLRRSLQAQPAARPHLHVSSGAAVTACLPARCLPALLCLHDCSYVQAWHCRRCHTHASHRPQPKVALKRHNNLQVWHQHCRGDRRRHHHLHRGLWPAARSGGFCQRDRSGSVSRLCRVRCHAAGGISRRVQCQASVANAGIAEKKKGSTQRCQALLSLTCMVQVECHGLQRSVCGLLRARLGTGFHCRRQSLWRRQGCERRGRPGPGLQWPRCGLRLTPDDVALLSC